MYLIKVPSNKMQKVLKVLETYDIQTLASFSSETFFGIDVSVFLSVKPSEGITTEEKERLIKENLSAYNPQNLS